VVQDPTARLHPSLAAVTEFEAATTTAVVSMYHSRQMVPTMSVQDQADQQTVLFIGHHHMDLVDLHQKLVRYADMTCFGFYFF